MGCQRHAICRSIDVGCLCCLSHCQVSRSALKELRRDAQHGAWAYRDIPGFCKAETVEGIKKHGFVLTPGRYVGAEAQEDNGELFPEKYPRLLAELEVCFGEGGAVDEGGRCRISRTSPRPRCPTARY